MVSLAMILHDHGSLGKILARSCQDLGKHTHASWQACQDSCHWVSLRTKPERTFHLFHISVRAAMSGNSEVQVQEDHPHHRHLPHPDAVLPARVSPHSQDHAPRLSQGAVRTVLRLRLCMGLRGSNVPGPSESIGYFFKKFLLFPEFLTST